MRDFKKTNLMRQIERRYPGKSIDQIVADAINRTGSAEAAADDLGVNPDTLRRLWMPALGISTETKAVVQRP